MEHSWVLVMQMVQSLTHPAAKAGGGTARHQDGSRPDRSADRPLVAGPQNNIIYIDAQLDLISRHRGKIIV